MQLSETSFFRENVDGWTILLCVNQSVIVKKIKNRNSEESMYLYTYERMVFSILLASDFYSTSEFMSEITIDNFGELNDINEFYDVYKRTDIYRSIRRYEEKEYSKLEEIDSTYTTVKEREEERAKVQNEDEIDR